MAQYELPITTADERVIETALAKHAEVQQRWQQPPLISTVQGWLEATIDAALMSLRREQAAERTARLQAVLREATPEDQVHLQALHANHPELMEPPPS
jgi:hypothetical protein